MTSRSAQFGDANLVLSIHGKVVEAGFLKAGACFEGHHLGDLRYLGRGCLSVKVGIFPAYIASLLIARGVLRDPP